MIIIIFSIIIIIVVIIITTEDGVHLSMAYVGGDLEAAAELYGRQHSYVSSSPGRGL